MNDFADWVADANKLDRMLRILGVLTAEEMERFIDGAINIYVMADREFERRFPAEYAAWDARQQK